MVRLNPIIQFQLHRVADFVLNEHLNGLFVGSRFVGIVFWNHNLSLRMRGVHEVGPAPLGVGGLDNIGVLLVVGLHLVGQSIGNVNVGQVNGDEERAVVVGRVSCRLLNITVARNADIKGAVLGRIIGVLEPHSTNKVKLFACCHP